MESSSPDICFYLCHTPEFLKLAFDDSSIRNITFFFCQDTELSSITNHLRIASSPWRGYGKISHTLRGLLPFWVRESSSLQAWDAGDITRQPAIPKAPLKVLQTSLSFTGCHNDLSVRFHCEPCSATPCCLRLPISFPTCAGFTSSSDTQCSTHRLNSTQIGFDIRCPWDFRKRPLQELYHSTLCIS